MRVSESRKLKSESTKVFCDGILRGVGVLSNFLQIEYKIKSSIVILNSAVLW